MGSTRRGNILNPNERRAVRSVNGRGVGASGDFNLQTGDVLGLVAALAACEVTAHKDQAGGYPGIGPDGSVTDAKVVVPIHPAYDRILLEAVRTTWKYEPAVRNGVAVASAVKVRVVLPPR